MPVSVLNQWHAESVRASFFVGAGWALRPIYGEFAGAPPSESVSRGTGQFMQETGTDGGMQITVTQQLGRVDVVVSGTARDLATGFQPFGGIGPLKAAAERFDHLATGAAKCTGASTIRAAFAISALRICSSLEEAATFLKQLLPNIEIDPAVDTDLIFQINRPRQLEGVGRVNRLMKWDIVQTALLKVDPARLGTANVSPQTLSTAVRAYIDISTDATRTSPIESDGLLHLVKQLGEFGLEIADRGDVR